MRTIRIGELLVQAGVLSAAQRDAIVRAQQLAHARRPFGVLAEELFNVRPGAVERAWAEQYASFSPSLDVRSIHPESAALGLISARQAWQFRLLPLRVRDGALTACTTADNLPRAMKFAAWKLDAPCEFLLAEPLRLGEAMMEWYALAGMSPKVIEIGAFALRA